MSSEPTAQTTTPSNNENRGILWNILFNVVIPSVILTKLSKPEYLGQLPALIIALLFPFCYGAIELIKNKKWNFISLLGLVSILLTGGLTLLKLEGIWFAVKEAMIPLIIGVAVIALYRTEYSIFKVLLFNPKIFRIELIKSRLQQKNHDSDFEKLLFISNLLFAFSFLLSAILNFSLAVFILKSPTGTVEFNEELGRMAALSYPVIMIPCMIATFAAIWYLLSGIKKFTGLALEEIFNEAPKQ